MTKGSVEGKRTINRPDIRHGQMIPLWTDLSKGEWPFRPNVFAAIINVHFVMPALFEFFRYSLRPGGYLLCETFGGHGENYRELPKAGEWKASLVSWLSIDMYVEKPAGPDGQSAVSVKLLGRKN